MPENLYRRGKTWWARIIVRGKEVRRSLRTNSKVEARKRLEELRKDVQHFRFHGEERRTWKAAVIEWSTAAAADLKPAVLKRYKVSLRQVRHLLDELYIDEIDRGVISRITRRPGVTNATRRRDLTAVSSVLGWCVAHGWAETNPAREWDRRAIRERRDPISLPSEADIDAVVRRCPANFAGLVRLAQYTGMRQEEVASLSHRQIDRVRNTIELRRTKTNSPRSVPLDERAHGTLSGTSRYVSSPYVFWHDQGERYANVSSRFAQIVASAIKAAERDKTYRPQRFRFHDLRHWYAVDYLRRGGNIYDLQQILGHASIKTTELYLAFLTPDEQRTAKHGTTA